MEPIGRQGAWRYFVVSRVNIGLGRRRKAEGRCVTLSGVKVIAFRCIRRPGSWKKTRASARKLVDPGSPGGTSALQGAHLRSEERRVGNECVSTCRFRWTPLT